MSVQACADQFSLITDNRGLAINLLDLLPRFYWSLSTVESQTLACNEKERFPKKHLNNFLRTDA